MKIETALNQFHVVAISNADMQSKCITNAIYVNLLTHTFMTSRKIYNKNMQTNDNLRLFVHTQQFRF